MQGKLLKIIIITHDILHVMKHSGYNNATQGLTKEPQEDECDCSKDMVVRRSSRF